MKDLLCAMVLASLVYSTTPQDQEEPYRDEPYSPDELFYRWARNPNKAFYLTEKQATFWYSLGEYRPRETDELLRYPRPVYERPVYDYPPYGAGGCGADPRCEEIPPPTRTRREFREMTPDQKTAYVNAVMALVNYIPDSEDSDTSAYDIFVGLHQMLQSPGAHGGASFLPFHREYLWRFENALILHGNYPATLGLPFWDSILDSSLPNPTDSVMWTPDFMGDNQGVLKAPFEGMTVPEFCSGVVERNAAESGFADFLFKEEDMEVLMSQSCFAQLTQNQAWDCWGWPCNFEGRHGGPHIWFGYGSDMNNYCSPSDPIFWLHHGFIDCAWEDFRQNRQETNLEKEYPQSSFGGLPFAWNSKMAPFEGLINAHGLSTHYTTYYYQCADRPSGRRCCGDEDCNRLGNDNPALWCHNGTCKSKIQVGGSCSHLPDKACWCKSGSPRCLRESCHCLHVAEPHDMELPNERPTPQFGVHH